MAAGGLLELYYAVFVWIADVNILESMGFDVCMLYALQNLCIELQKINININ
jgi:hypothetical protein